MKQNSMTVWLDHSRARILSIEDDHIKISTIHSSYNRHVRIRGKGSDKTQYDNLFAGNRESAKHHKRQNELEEFYSGIEKRLLDASDILIMGPTNAGEQLLHHLEKNKKFQEIPVSIKKTDYITEPQIVSLAKKYFIRMIKSDENVAAPA